MFCSVWIVKLQEYAMAIVCCVIAIPFFLDTNSLFFFWREEMEIYNLDLLNWLFLQ